MNTERRRRIWERGAAFILMSVFALIALGLILALAKPGYSQTLAGPDVSFSIVTVDSPRELPLLAERYHTTAEQILRENPKVKMIRPGTILTIKENYLEQEVSRGSTSSWVWPLSGPVSSAYGQREGDFHHGLDIAVPPGITVRAARPGRVSKAGRFPIYGLTVVVDHGNGVQTLYAHNSKLKVKVGDSVEKGEGIAVSGNTGKTTGPHLHFEVRLSGQTIDPLKVLPKQLLASAVSN